jgi:hypothetical protein
MDTHKIIQSQYLAALEMLKQVIVKCPAALWNAPGDKAKVWQTLYHTLFYVHLYLYDVEADFSPWEKHHDPDTGIPFSQEQVLEYLDFCQQHVRQRVPLLNLEAESGFSWLPFNKLELQFYNIRHIQQHTGELYERLGTRENIELDWVGRQPA